MSLSTEQSEINPLPVMNTQIKELWIESEEKGAIIGGTLETNDNSDVIVTLHNGNRYVATFFTYENIEHLRRKNQKTGECLNGRYFWATDMIIVERINRREVKEIIEHLLAENEFQQTFEKIEIE